MYEKLKAEFTLSRRMRHRTTMVGTVWFLFTSFVAGSAPVTSFPIFDVTAVSRRAVLLNMGLFDAADFDSNQGAVDQRSDDDEGSADAYEIKKRKLKAQIQKRDHEGYFTPAKTGVQWTPTKNPNPIADEPWFTG